MDYRKDTAPTVRPDVGTIYVAIELSRKSWLLLQQSPRQERASQHKLAAADAAGLWAVIARERDQLLRAGYGRVRVVSCYEAGRDGFWLHRFLVGQGVESQVVDPGSVLVNRRARRAKTDRLDAEGLLRLVMRHDAGDRHLGRMVVVPSVAEEDARRPERERRRLLNERTAHSNRLQGLLALHGVYGYRPLRADRRIQLATLRCADGQALPGWLRIEIERELERLELAEAQVAALEKARRVAHQAAPDDDPVARIVRQLMRLKSIALQTASVLAHEVLYRDFANRRKVTSFVGLCPSPFRSGGLEHEQGLSKAGNKRARAVLLELAWSWVRLQPESAITHWFKTNVAGASKRRRKQLIVAVARRLLVALWRYVTTGELPPGARLKPS